MKHHNAILSIAFLFLSYIGLYAQEVAYTDSLGNATGSGGISDYSVGKTLNMTNTSPSGSVTQGEQQPYEIVLLDVPKVNTNNVELSTSPNPTSDFLYLKAERDKNLNYELFNLYGRLIRKEKITETNNSIVMEYLPAATYFLKVNNYNKILKTYKIIKK